jgi:hypothetical protein
MWVMVTVPDEPQSSYEELAVLVIALGAEIADLKAQLKQNSKNSSRAPSSDSPFVKLAPKWLRVTTPTNIDLGLS